MHAEEIFVAFSSEKFREISYFIDICKKSDKKVEGKFIFSARKNEKAFQLFVQWFRHTCKIIFDV